jgi:hypothetical protein
MRLVVLKHLSMGNSVLSIESHVALTLGSWHLQESELQPAAAQGIDLRLQPSQQAPAAAAAFGITPLLQQEQARRDFERQLSTHQFERQLSTQLSAQLSAQLSVRPQPPPPPPPPQHSQQLERQLSSQLSAQLSAQLSTQLSGHPLQPPPPPPPPPGLWQAHSAVPASQLRTASQPLYPNASAVPGMHRGHLGTPDFGAQPPPPPPTLQQVPDALAGIAEAAAAAAVQQFAAADAARQNLQPPTLQGRRLLSATSAPGFGGAEALLAERAQRASQLLPAAGGGFTRRSFDIGVLIAMASVHAAHRQLPNLTPELSLLGCACLLLPFEHRALPTAQTVLSGLLQSGTPIKMHVGACRAFRW